MFSLTGFFYARHKGRRKSAAQSFVPSKKSADRDYLRQALEEVRQEEPQSPAPEPSAPEKAEGT